MATDENGFVGCLRDFVSAHERGWSHREWLGLLVELTDAGFDTSDPDQIGMALEREHVKRLLEGTGVRGVGPRRREAVAETFGTVWNLRHATVEDLAETPGFHRGLAEALHVALH